MILLIILFRLIFPILLFLRMRSVLVKFFNLTFIFFKNNFFYSCSCNFLVLVRKWTIRLNMTWLVAVIANNSIVLGGSVYHITQFYWVFTICGIGSHIPPLSTMTELSDSSGLYYFQ